VAAAVLGGAAVLLWGPLHARLLELIASADGLIRAYPAWGMVVFVLLAAVSAMLAFISSAALIPVAIYAWGPTRCAVLLWLGWFIGGVLSYLVGRFLGRPIVARLLRPATMARYEAYAHRGAAFVPILLLQLAVPSDTAGYLFGMVRCPVGIYLVALALAEVPYAVGAVYLGTSFLERRLLPLLLLGAAGALLGIVALRRVRRSVEGSKTLDASPSTGDP
jgi:uncharacterized membrane protein YdjX (TVP38/TMEM64 family)